MDCGDGSDAVVDGEAVQMNWDICVTVNHTTYLVI
jgi:hypothetical protein